MTDKDKMKGQVPEENKTEETQKEEKEVLPPLDFSSLILPFFTQALFKLGELDEADTTGKAEKMELVKRFVDLLDILKSRTQGNLKQEEEIFLDQCLHQLRIAYMEKAKIISL